MVDIFGEAKKFMQKAMAFRSKDEVVADRLFNTLVGRGWPIKGRRDQQNYHKVIFAPPLEQLESFIVEVKVPGAARPAGGAVGAAIGMLGMLGPVRINVNFTVVLKEASLVARLTGKNLRRYAFTLNASDYIDDSLNIIDPKTLDALFASWLQSMGFG